MTPSPEYTEEQIQEALKQAEAHESHNRLIRVKEPCACPSCILAWAYRRERQSLEFSREWWSTRIERLSQWVRENPLPEPFMNQYFCIIANGTKDASEPHQYWPMYNQLKHRAEKAEATVEALRKQLIAARAVADGVHRLMEDPENEKAYEAMAICLFSWDAAVREAGDKETK